MSEVYLPKRLNWDCYSIAILFIFYTLFVMCAYLILDGAFRFIDFPEPSLAFFFAGLAAGFFMAHCYKQI